MDAQITKKFSLKILDFCKIFKIHEKNYKIRELKPKLNFEIEDGCEAPFKPSCPKYVNLF